MLPQSLLERFDVAARRASPEEACGLLLGTTDSEACRISDIALSDNVARSDRQHRFEIDSGLQLRLQREVRHSDTQILGVWHSHPASDAVPSVLDKQGYKQDGDVWIISGKINSLAVHRLWRWDAALADFTPQIFEIVPR